MKEQLHTITMPLHITFEVGPDCDGGEELRRVRFVDLNEGLQVELSDYKKNGFTVAQEIEDRCAEAILAAHRKQNRVER